MPCLIDGDILQPHGYQWYTNYELMPQSLCLTVPYCLIKMSQFIKLERQSFTPYMPE